MFFDTIRRKSIVFINKRAPFRKRCSLIYHLLNFAYTFQPSASLKQAKIPVDAFEIEV